MLLLYFFWSIPVRKGDELPTFDHSNFQPADVYMDKCLNITFKHSFFFIYILSGEYDRVRLDEMHDDLWVRMMPIKEWIMKHLKLTNDVMNSDHSIAYTNLRCQAVSNEIRKRMGKTEKYEIREVMICRVHRNVEEEGKFNVNIRCQIIRQNGWKYKIQYIKDSDDVRVVDVYVLNNRFRYAYCATCHSRQGASVSLVVIFLTWPRCCNCDHQPTHKK